MTNALSPKAAEELFDVTLRSRKGGARPILVAGAGHTFCVGGDLAEMQTVDDAHTQFIWKSTWFHATLTISSDIDLPVIAAVNGAAAGASFSFVSACDHVIAARTANFVSDYTVAGLTPDGSSTYFLAKHVDLMRAKEQMLTNRPLSAERAADCGILNSVVELETLHAEAEVAARTFASGATKACCGPPIPMGLKRNSTGTHAPLPI